MANSSFYKLYFYLLKIFKIVRSVCLGVCADDVKEKSLEVTGAKCKTVSGAVSVGFANNLSATVSDS